MNFYLKYLTLLLTLAPLFASPQKLPKIQTRSVRAPQNIKIDGRLNEWSGFEAYNSGQHIHYTLSNDGDNLYFIAQMDDFVGTRKIFRGGLDFSIGPASNPRSQIIINFPVIPLKRNGELEHQDGGGPIFRFNMLQKNSNANKTQMEALTLSANKTLTKDYKYIYVAGIPEITDTLISVYNTQGIMVAAGFDKNMRYTYELAIPLKYLQSALTDAKSLRYNVKLRTRPITYIPPPPPPGPVVSLRYIGPASIDDEFLFSDTDFSGEYTLAPTQ